MSEKRGERGGGEERTESGNEIIIPFHFLLF